jgi:pimeloyl-ACP methyl ester carboxylesterase
MQTAQINGTTIAFSDTGGSGPAVILSHGYLMDHTMFDSQVAVLKDDYRVITWDERGFGGTHAPGEFTYWDSAKDVLALMDYLGIENAVVGGMSQGGYLSLRTALTAPKRVRALILIDTQAGPEDASKVEPYHQLMAAWNAHGSKSVQDIIAGIILGPGSWQAWFDKWERLPVEQLNFAFDCLMNRDDITTRMGEINCPTLIVHGTADASIPIAMAEVLRDKIAGKTTMTIIEGAPHAANITHAEQVNKAIVKFLSELG